MKNSTCGANKRQRVYEFLHAIGECILPEKKPFQRRSRIKEEDL